MKQQDMEQMLRSAVSHAAPDVLESIYARLDGEKGTEKSMEQNLHQNSGKKRNHFGRYAAFAAGAVALFAIGLLAGKVLPGAAATQPGNAPASAAPQVAAVIALDVNPSVQLKIDKEERVIEAAATNEDGKGILGDMDLTGAKADVAVNALVGAMLQQGYLDELANSILITVEGMSGVEATALEQKLVSQVQGILDKSAAGGAILSQTLTPGTALTQQAADYGISEGKAALIQGILANNTLHTFDELATLSIHELNLISQNTVVEDVTSTGSASDKGYIGKEKAASIALADAGVAEESARKLSAEMDYEKSRMLYEVEFECQGMEYEYDVDAITGEVLWKESEMDDDQHAQHGASLGESAIVMDSDSGEVIRAGSAPVDESWIGKEKAKAIALSHAGLSESQVTKLKAELERDDGRTIYEVDFKSGGYEYDYDIDASSGAVIKWDKDPDD